MPTGQTKDLRIEALNGRTMRGKDWEMIEEMKKYDLSILGISETKWKGSGAKDIEDFYVIYSGVKSKSGRGSGPIRAIEKVCE